MVLVYLGAGKLQGLTGAEAQPQVITMFFFDFLLQSQILGFS